VSKENMKGLQKGFSEAGGDNDPLVKAIKERKKAISAKISGWFKPSPTPVPEQE
jgi:hypothetical protein